MLDQLLRRLITKGSLTVIDHQGNIRHFEGDPGKRVTVRLMDSKIERELALKADLALGEGFMDGRIVIEEGSLHDLLALVLQNEIQARQNTMWLRLLNIGPKLLKRWHQFNPLHKAKANIEHHYDLKDELYALFLDRDRQYSCAYYQSPNDSIDQAQWQKKCHLAAKLRLNPGQKVLDIGSGWGGLGLFLANQAEVDVTGLTLSNEQFNVSNDRAQQAGLDGRVRFLLQDYREINQTFDRIVSVGMFEHVGVNHYRAYFDQVRNLLKDDGMAVLHSIGRMSGPTHTSAWIRKYIFPGGYIPALSEVLPAIEKAGLWVTDVEILRLHYAETVKAWYDRFQANRDKVKTTYDERFCRMWEFYLVSSEMFFRVQDGMVFQIQLSRSIDAVPLTRDYITDAERELTKMASEAKTYEAA